MASSGSALLGLHPGLLGGGCWGKKTLSEDIVVLLLLGLVGPLGTMGGGGALVMASLKQETQNKLKLISYRTFLDAFYVPLAHSGHGFPVIRVLQYSIWLSSTVDWTLLLWLVSTRVVIRRLEQSETSWFLRCSWCSSVVRLVVWNIVGSLGISVKIIDI